MKIQKFVIFVLLVAGSFSIRAGETPAWLQSLQSPVSAPVRFYGQFVANGRVAVSLGGVTAANTNNVSGWICGDSSSGTIYTPLKEVDLEIYKTYSLNISGTNVYDAKAYLQEPHLTDLLAGKGKNSQQYNRYRLYVLKPGEADWKLLCNDSPPGWNAEDPGTGAADGNINCESMSITYQIQLRPDVGARPMVQPGLSATYGSADVDIWERDEDPAAQSSAPGDEDPLAISADKTGYTADRASIMWGVNLGHLRDGQPAGKVRIIETFLSANILTPAALVYSARSDDTNELDVVMAGTPSAIRQIKAVEAFVDVATLSSTNYEVRFYPTNAFGAKAGGLYPMIGSPSPFVTWRIDSAGFPNTFRIQETRNGTTKSSLLTFTGTNLWTLTRGVGNEARIVTRQVTMQPQGTNHWDRIDVEEVKDGLGRTSSKTGEFWTDYGARHELTRVTNGVGGPALITAFTYASISDGTSQLGSTIYPDGYWERRTYSSDTNDDYHPYGSLVRIIQPWKDSPIGSADNDCLVTSYYYQASGDGSFRLQRWHDAASLGEDVSSDNMDTRLLSTTYEEETYFDEDACSGATQIAQASKIGGRYGDSVTTKTESAYAGRLAGQLYSKFADSGKLDAYDYVFGQWNGVNHTFAGTGSTNDLAQIIYHGTSYSVSALADAMDVGETTVYLHRNKSTKEVRVVTGGHLVLKELYVYVDTVTGFSLVERTTYDRDILGHLTNVTRYPSLSSGPIIIYQADWSGGSAFPGDLKLSQTDQSGVKTLFTYDSLKRVKTSTKEGASVAGHPSQANIVQTLDYDASADVLTNTIAAGTLVQRTIAQFDLAGRLTNALSIDGLTTSYSYPNGGSQTNATFSSGTTRFAQTYLDRRPVSVTGTAVLNQFFDYSFVGTGSIIVSPNPKNITLVRTGAVTSARWKKSITDYRYQLAEETQPGFGSTFEKYKIYDQRSPGGLLEHISEMGLYEDGSYEFRTWYDRNEFGDVIAAATSGNGPWFRPDTSPAGPDRVTQSNEYFEQNAQAHWFKVSEQLTFPLDTDATSVLVSWTKERLSGFGANQISQTYTYDADTNQTVTTVTVNLTNKTVTTAVTQPQSSLTATQVSVNGLPQTESTLTVATPTWHYYDAVGREVGMTDSLGFASGTRYDTNTSQVMATTNKSGKITSYQYYPAGGTNAGLLYCETGPTGKKKYQNYNGRGQVTQVWGDVPYPQQMSYNSFGDLVTLTTYRTNNVAWTGTNWPSPTGGDVTSWSYDEPTGLLTNKTDAAGQGVQYDYYANYLPKSTTLARGVGTFTTYADNGDLTQVDITNKWTGSTVISSVISSNYNRMGTARSVFDDAGEHKLVYDYANRVLSEAYTNGLLNGTVLTYHYDPAKGKDKLTVRTPSGTWLTNQYGFDGYGRMASVTNGGSYFSSYTYLPNSDLLQTTTSQNGTTNILTSTRTWENGYRLKSIGNVAAGRTASGHTYDYDNLDRRWRATLEDGSAWNYGYNDRDELTSGKRSWSDASAVSGQQFEYLYDLIGNRTNELAGGDTSGANLRQTSYTVNNLNEYSRIITPGYKDVLGLATVSDTVTVNNGAGGGTADRKNDYFHREITVGNGGAPICQAVATVSGANNTSGNLIVAKNDQTLANDVDGNLMFDGIWSYQWTAENRLASVNMTNVSNVTNALRKKVDFVYDSEGHRISKTVSTWNGTTFGSPVTNRFITDGWRIVAEIDSSGNPTRSYMWGLDVSGSLENAGGIGGLLMVRDHSGGSYHFAGSDGNGNVTVLVNATTQNISARYEYSPYNELLRATGPVAALNNICAASKYWDRETKLSYIGQRYYSPSLGRWICKDLAGENGGINLYEFVKNQPIVKIDPTGLATLGEQAAAAGIAAGLGEGIEIGVTLVGRVRETVEAINAVQEVGSVIIDFEVEAGEGIEAFETVMEATSRAAQGFRNGSTSLNRMGQAVHKAYSGVKDMALELSNGKRVDFIDFAKGIVRELKPNNLRAIRLGGKQLEGYLKVLRSEFPNIEWKGLIDTYSF